MSFIHEDFLLDTPAAQELYHRYAAPMPIIDYHCHLPPEEIATNKRWSNIAEVWLGGDHYKWRQLRWCGFPESLCSGKGSEGTASNWDRFHAYAEAMELLVNNPLFDWSHLELARYFGITERLCRASAPRIYETCNRSLERDPNLSAQGLMRRSNVRVVCTTDDPIDTLEHHKFILENPFGVQVRPTWRSDKASKIERLKDWNQWIDALGASAQMDITTYQDFLEAMGKRHDYFASCGCRLSDYGLGDIYATDYTEAVIATIFAKARAGNPLSIEEIQQFKSAWLFEGLKADAASGWTTQLHFNCQRNLNTKQYQQLGADTGYDAIGDWSVGESIARLFDRLEQIDALPRCIVYSLNPKDNALLASILGSFQRAPTRGKLQLGAAWWFLDQKYGMRQHIESLSALGALGTFVGMLTDSRSFLSYTRHEYFRRLLCQKLGQDVANGELPNDIPWLGGIVSDIAFNNANRYFGFEA